MLAKVWRHHNFSSIQCRVSSNDCGGLFQASYPVRLTPRRRESLLKVCEVGARFIMPVGWMAHCYSSLVFLVGPARSQVVSWPIDTGQVRVLGSGKDIANQAVAHRLRLCPLTLIQQQTL